MPPDDDDPEKQRDSHAPLEDGSLWQRARKVLFGPPRDLHDPHVFHKISLIAFLAWVGLGADGLSSSAYGPDETFRALGSHPHLAVFLALATAITVLVISSSYARIIEHFPHGGGGYLVATKLLGAPFGLVSGCALLIDYVLTIATSIASAGDQVFSLLPAEWHGWKVSAEVAIIVLLIVLNLRGLKESISVMVPIFLLFIATHLVVVMGAFVLHGHQIPAIAAGVVDGVRADARSLGTLGILALLIQAYSRGAGTYTGIEAVSNGLQIMREPRVPTAKRTMTYMGISLAVTAGGILLCYLLVGATPVEGKTLNAVLIERLGIGTWFEVLALGAEAALLFVAAQAGFIDGPRVMANMALDSWLPHRFSALSDRLTMHYGIVLMGAASILTLVYTKGQIDALVTMYSINVFITFSLSQAGMVRYWLRERGRQPRWKRSLALQTTGLLLCVGILSVVIYEKLGQGAWMTLVVTSVLIGVCILIRRHYRTVVHMLAKLGEDLDQLPLVAEPAPAGPLDPKKPVAVLLVASYGGLGVHSLLTIFRLLPAYFSQVRFLSVAVLDSGSFKGADEVERLEAEAARSLERYVTLARGLGLVADARSTTGIEAVEAADRLCRETAEELPKAVFFAGKLIFQRERFWQRILHNETAYQIQTRLQWSGLPMVVLPVRVYG